MSGWISAVLVALVGLALTSFWFGVSRRRRAEAQIGVQSLATLKWRDSIGIILEWLQRDGYHLLTDSASGGTEFLLRHGSEKVLLDYKHGTAYRIGDAGVREFGNALRLRGADRGILVTLGSIETGALQAVVDGKMQLVDGAHLWAHVRPYIGEGMMSSVRAEAAAATRKGMWTGVLASVLAGAAFLMLGNAPVAQPVVTPVATLPAASPASPASTTPPEDAMLRQLNATAEAMAEVARLTPAQLAERRAAAAKQVSQIAQVDTAAWSAQSTLLISLNSSDGKDKVLIEEACRILVQNEEMRFTHIQLNPPVDSRFAVRWRLCG